MRTVVVYESLYGNTHHVAEMIAAAAAGHGEVALVPVSGALREVIEGADLLFVGGPTHAHGMSSEQSRKGGIASAGKHGEVVDPDAEGPGLRDWFTTIGDMTGMVAVAFDTRVGIAPFLSGRASKSIAKRLRQHGARLVAEPESFLVDKENHLLAGEDQRAQGWAEAIMQLTFQNT